MTGRLYSLLLPALLVLTLGGCLGGGNGNAAPPPDAVAATDLPAGAADEDGAEVTDADIADAGGAEAGGAEASSPDSGSAGAPQEPDTARAVDMRDFMPAPTPLPPVLRDRQTACERDGGQLVQRGRSGIYDCMRQTRDSGRRCTRETDCEGQCLARSGTCAPFTPLFGCHEVLDRGGSRVTICLQ
ncbi:MAG: hypothetical protein ACXIVG_04500 [Pararhodobacter sp.]